MEARRWPLALHSVVVEMCQVVEWIGDFASMHGHLMSLRAVSGANHRAALGGDVNKKCWHQNRLPQAPRTTWSMYVLHERL